MSETAKLVSKGAQRFCPVTNRVISTIFGMNKDGEIAVIDTCVSTVEDFTFWCGLNIETMKAIERHNAEQHIKSLPKGRRRKASNVVQLKRG